VQLEYVFFFLEVPLHVRRSSLFQVKFPMVKLIPTVVCQKTFTAKMIITVIINLSFNMPHNYMLRVSISCEQGGHTVTTLCKKRHGIYKLYYK